MGTIATEATEANSILLLTECRRCLALGVDMKGSWIKIAIANLEVASTASVAARVDQAVDNLNDGRNTAEVVVIT